MYIFSEKSVDYYEKLFCLATDAALSAVCLDIFKRRASNPADSNHAKIQEYLARIWFSTEIEVSPEERELVGINQMEILNKELKPIYFCSTKLAWNAC